MKYTLDHQKSLLELLKSSRKGWDQEPYKNSKAQPQHVVAEEKHPVNNKSQEMDALKAKLLSMKK
jgi:hypothetical protein